MRILSPTSSIIKRNKKEH